jgi:hypothetical protein
MVISQRVKPASSPRTTLHFRTTTMSPLPSQASGHCETPSCRVSVIKQELPTAHHAPGDVFEDESAFFGG